MKRFLTAALMCSLAICQAQYEYEPSMEYPYGRANPEAAQQLKDYEAIIGKC